MSDNPTLINQTDEMDILTLYSAYYIMRHLDYILNITFY